MPIDNVIDGKEGGDLAYCQLYDEKTGILRPYTEQVQNNDPQGTAVEAYGDPATEITRIDANAMLVKTFDGAAIEAAYLGLAPVSYPVNINLQLPDVLISVIVGYSKSKGEGSASDQGGAASSGSTVSGSASSSAKASSSLSIVADPVPQIQQTWGRDIEVTEYLFYMKGNQTGATLRTKLGTIIGTTVNAWPVFHPQAHTISAPGGQIGLSTSANVQESISISPGNSSITYSVGDGSQVDTGATFRSITISPTLHGALTIGNPLESDSITANATAKFTGTGSFTTREAGTGGLVSNTKSLSLVVTPRTLAATVPSDIPRSGLYLVDKRFQIAEGEILLVTAQVLDASIFQLAISDFVYSDPNPTYTNLSLIEPNVPSHTGGAVASYSISPSLLTGLSLNTTTGVISGTPNYGGAPVTYTVTATNALGSTTTSVTITIVAP